MSDTTRVSPLRTSEFNAFIDAHTGHVLIDFWAPWCGPCRALAPTLENFAEKLEGVVAVRKVNIDEEQELAAAFDIRSVPTLILFKDGQPRSQVSGFKSESQLVSWVSSVL